MRVGVMVVVERERAEVGRERAEAVLAGGAVGEAVGEATASQDMAWPWLAAEAPREVGRTAGWSMAAAPARLPLECLPVPLTAHRPWRQSLHRLKRLQQLSVR